MMTTLRWWGLTALLMLFVAACRGTENDATPIVQFVGPTVAPNMIPIETSTPMPEPTTPPEPTAGPDDLLIIADINSDYSTYTHYEINVNLLITDRDTDAIAQLVEMSVQVQTDPSAQQVTMLAQGVDDALGNDLLSIQIATVDGQAYMDVPEMGCITLPSGDLDNTPFASLLETDTLLDGLRSAQRVLPNQTINGVDAKHYVFDGRFFENAEQSSDVEGDLWIDSNSNQLIRLEMTGEGADIAVSLTGEEATEAGNSERFTMRYDVLNRNVPFEVSIPDACVEESANEGEAYPIFEDAYEHSSFGGLVNYKTVAPMDEVTRFYQDALAADGWVYEVDRSFETGAVATLLFSREENTISILIAPDSTEDATSVTIMEQ